MNRLKLFILVLSLVIVYCWSFRAYLLTPLDYPYLNDLYDHSQWSVPNSIRTIGDDGRYEIAGYRLVNGGKLYEVAPEVPPLGKYLIGYAIKYFHNASLIAVPFTILTILLFYLLSETFLQSQKKRYFATLIFALSPQIINNSYRITLDLPQLAMLLLHFVLFFAALKTTTKKKMWTLSAGAGIALGLFISIKFGIFVLPVLIAETVLLYKKQKLYLLLPNILAMPLVYTATTVQFFIQHGTLTEWISAQKWIVNFYKTSNTGFIPGMVLLTLATSVYKGWWNSGWESTTEWSILMPIGLGMLSYLLYRKYKERFDLNPERTFLLLYTSATLILLSLIAFWPRYLVLVVPFFILIIVEFFPRFKYIKHISFALCIIIILQAINLLFPQPSEFLNSFKMNRENSTYQEIYGMLDTNFQQTMNRDLFWREMLETDNQLQVTGKQVSVTSGLVFPWQSQTPFTMKTHYTTPLGSFDTSYTGTLIRVRNQWKMVWEWESIAPHFSPSDTIESNITHTAAVKTPYIFITPNTISNENDLIYSVAEITGQKRYIVIKKYLENTPSDWQAPIGFVKENYQQTELQKLATNAAVTIKSKELPQQNDHTSGIIALQKKDGRRFILLFKEK